MLLSGVLTLEGVEISLTQQVVRAQILDDLIEVPAVKCTPSLTPGTSKAGRRCAVCVCVR